MKLSDYKKEMKKKMGWRWYLIKFQLLFDFDHQHWIWLTKRHLHHLTKAEEYRKKIKQLDHD